MNETSPLPQESDKEHAALSRVSYELGKTIDGWIRKDEFDDPESGFRAAIFQRKNSKEYVLAFAGTDFGTFTDLTTDARQAFGLETKQYQQAAKIAKKFQETYGGDGAKLSLAGHSLGGGQATLASAVTGLPAVVINPAGVHDNTLKRHDVIPEEFRKEAETGLIRNIIVEGEILDWLNGKSPVEALSEARQAAADKVESVVAGAIDEAVDTAKTVAGKVENVASHVGDAVMPALNSVGNVVSDTAGKVSSAVRSAAEAIDNTVNDAAGYVVEAAKPVFDTVGHAAVTNA